MSRAGRAQRHTLVIVALLAALDACGSTSSRRPTSRDLPLAIAASESLTIALQDSVGPANGYAPALTSGIEALSACDDRADATGWETFSSTIVEMELPPGFRSAGQVSQRAEWQAADAYVAATGSSSSLHSGWTGLITSECDVYVGGWPTHIDLVNTTYGKGVHATIQAERQSIAIDAQAKSIGRQAQLLHSIRYARVSSAWGR